MSMVENPLITLAANDRHEACCAGNKCAECGAHVSGYNANAELIRHRPEAAGSDWWCACDNADCVNAYGEDFWQGMPDWVETR